MHGLGRTLRRNAAIGAGVSALIGAALTVTPMRAGAVTTGCTAGSPEANVSENGFICPVKIPGSAGFGEPSMAHDTGTGNGGVPRLFVIAPAGVPTAVGGHTSSP
ncbi:MAG TPA: hypothetical protein VFA70_02015, partial [Dehalococcoidia bacterium]|nr:hypothetical protein [Dehalococcoidia bacterium]